MSNEVDNKIETIIISVINRLYKIEEQMGGLSEDDLKCFELICKVKKDYHPGEAAVVDASKDLPVTAQTVMDLMRKAKTKTDE